MDIFNKLGNDIEARWRDVDYDEAHLPEIAAAALAEHNIPAKIELWEVLNWALGEYELPRQRDLYANFADPPVTVFSGLRFHIDVYLWFEATTAIHQHGFCGAFQVLHGSSIHSWYDFKTERAINLFAEVGSLDLKVCELLEVGAIQPIRAGREYIHSLFHLESPSATIVVRTHLSPMSLPQLSYFKPNLAIDPFFEQETALKKMQLASALVRADYAQADEWIGRWLAEADFQTTFYILNTLRRYLAEDGVSEMFGQEPKRKRFAHFVKTAEARHGADVFSGVFSFQDTQDAVVRQRRLVSQQDLRFFVAVILNAPSRSRIFEIIRQRFPDADPLEKVLDWVHDLAMTRVAGSERSSVLGIADFGDIDLFVLEQMLKGKAGNEILQAFREENGEPTETHDLSGREQRIRTAPIFAPLLAE